MASIKVIIAGNGSKLSTIKWVQLTKLCIKTVFDSKAMPLSVYHIKILRKHAHDHRMTYVKV